MEEKEDSLVTWLHYALLLLRLKSAKLFEQPNIIIIGIFFYQIIRDCKIFIYQMTRRMYKFKSRSLDVASVTGLLLLYQYIISLYYHLEGTLGKFKRRIL